MYNSINKVVIWPYLGASYALMCARALLGGHVCVYVWASAREGSASQIHPKPEVGQTVSTQENVQPKDIRSALKRDALKVKSKKCLAK